ncbi:membrane-bound lytic murein transglycosylase D [Tahibacter aquaticus]|uniref:Membrane-bound lytic murein transglycosylase D n=1 Tax=Tahibacter aquaticus TaxID=520092 RepID=A0A4R6YX54_9GAMM|nr:transglycosylase SLT domain-containing protein [Tahibacter aquaticus]TDR43242.1 membrane-bound lytic murein transglycosylase D [Tahibacter aquaticus]
MYRLRFVPALAASLLLAACAGTPAKSDKAAKAPTAVDEAEIGTLYARLGEAVQRYEGSADLAASGERERAAREGNAALDDLRAAALRCKQLPGCEEERFLSAFDGLLRRDAPATAAAGGEKDAAPGEDGVPEAAGEGSPVVADLPETARAITLLKGRPLAEMIAVNEPVKAALEEWLTQYRPNLIQAYVNYQYMRQLMWPEYEKAGLPEALLFGFIAKESGGKVHAVSRSGASGPLQFMYATGLRFGLSTENGFDQRFDPALSARANAAYLNEQLRIFNNDLELVLAAYNGGEGRVGRLAGGGRARFYDSSVYTALAPETREYVPMVLAAAWLFMHPERYNLNFPRIETKLGSVVLPRSMSLSELSICFGQEGGSREGWFRTLRNLNPAYDHQASLPPGTRLDVPAVLEAAFPRTCAQGQWQALAAELHRASMPLVSTPSPALAARNRAAAGRSSYTVRKGDTLAAIARKHRCAEVREIASLNRLRAPGYAIKPGQTLQIPGCSR